ncbi:sialidase family protein [Noviherbaspirillum galbum]|uniref:Exo-alpha-sialidase n=1 Tax=Noviherbaspirillum galbum TaxID=2709383 RepID=A0A6B3SQR2_9BURK|nr:sialidase family protein [Noviherbaspirillum galbum]NEX59999.1 exo-alpha-sialidase [Noviherbaspirillum galbum]
MPIRATALIPLLALAMFGISPAGWGQHDSHEHRSSQANNHGKTAHAHGADLGTAAAMAGSGLLWLASKETQDGGQYVVVRSSEDMGKTWTAPVRVNAQAEPIAASGEARPHLAFGRKGELYVSWTSTVARPHIGNIRFARSLDGGKTFSPPLTVHANREHVTHSFESMIVDGDGRIFIAWIDGRDQASAKAKGKPYAGSAIYYAVSSDQGRSFRKDFRLADHSCECCRIGMSLDASGTPVAMWRHVFEPNVRDHAIARLTADGERIAITRVTFDDWRIDACPHHGPSLAFGADGVRHQVWFNGKEAEGSGAMYARVMPGETAIKPVGLGSAQASHPDVAAQGQRVAIVWKQFDGKSTALLGRVSGDNGRSWRDLALAETAGDSDKPYLVPTPTGMLVSWRTQAEGIRVIPLEKSGS